MTEKGAEKAVVTSALIVAGIYAYRSLIEPNSPKPTGGSSRVQQLAGKGSPPTIGVFITAWGMTFLVISTIASAAPGLGGSLALLVATGDMIGNLGQLAADINKKVTAAPASGTVVTPQQAAAINAAASGGHVQNPPGVPAHGGTF